MLDKTQIINAPNAAKSFMRSSLFSADPAKSLPQKPPSSIINSNGPLSNPTPAVRPWRREPLFLTQTRLFGPPRGYRSHCLVRDSGAQPELPRA